jgi:aspartyl-tRNA(Asn)/glutamyl-tRNA(Gln) amidotransferase subunit C
MAKLTRDDVLHLAELARIRLTEQEIARLETELGAILGYVEQLNDVDVTGLEPTTQVSGRTNVMRDDTPINYTAQPTVMVELAPNVEDGHIQVGRMVG